MIIQNAMLNVTEPTTPLNNADQGGSFFYPGGYAIVDSEKNNSMVKPPKTYKEQVEICQLPPLR